ncbi:MAG: hypothetical protein JWR21_4330 [Herminiimonas sp.]|nr:hypothetical protein [Herminiimonas sp.]
MEAGGANSPALRDVTRAVIQPAVPAGKRQMRAGITVATMPTR